MAQKKIGRPPSDNPLKDRIFVLVDDETKQKLKECKESLGTTTSDVVRKGMEMAHGSLSAF